MMSDNSMDQPTSIKVNVNYCKVITQLVQAVKAAGDNLLNGKTKLALTSTVLTYVNFGINNVLRDGVETHSEDQKAILPFKDSLNANLSYLHDVIRKSKGLKLTHGHQTLQGNVTISHFHHLQILEVRRIPIHLLVGLKDVRSNLTTVICSRSLQMLKDLFESCGGDQTTSSVWRKLNIAILSRNNIEIIDESVKLLPNLEILDLSHNNIKNIQNFQVLVKLKCLNVSFNQLEIFPRLSQKFHHLRCLSLRSNNLDKIDGLSVFCQLEQLDLGYNCLLHHSVLFPLQTLSSLKMLLLDGNPLWHHQQHRKLTIENLHHAVIMEKFSLDGQYLNGTEISYLKSGIEFAEEGIWAPVYVGDCDRLSVNSSSASLENSYSSSLAISQRQRRLRKVEFSDMDDEGDSTCGSPTTASLDFLKTKDELEKLRKEKGSHWLVASTRMNSPKLRPKIISDASPIEKNENETPRKITQTTVAEMEPNKLPLEVNENHGARKNVGEQTLTSEDEGYGTQGIILSDADASDGINNNFILPSVEITKAPEARGRDEDIYARSTTITEMKELDSDSRQLEIGTACTASDDENETERCSFIVQSKTANKTITVILIVKGNFVSEKNVSGQSLGRLDLRSLMSSERMRGDQHCCQLTFQSVRQDCRERTYTFEDEATYKEFQDMIQPIIEENIMKEMTEGAYQCFKCEAQFSKEVAMIAVQKDKTGKHEKVKVCPNCGSDVIMEVNEVPLPSSTKATEKAEKKTTSSKSRSATTTVSELPQTLGPSLAPRSQSITLECDQIMGSGIFDDKKINKRFDFSSKSVPNTPPVERNRFSEIMHHQQLRGQLESKARDELFSTCAEPNKFQRYGTGSKSCGHSPAQFSTEPKSLRDEETVTSASVIAAVDDSVLQEIGDMVLKFQMEDDDGTQVVIDDSGDDKIDASVRRNSDIGKSVSSENALCTQPISCGLKRCESDITILSQSSISTAGGDLLGLNPISELSWEVQRQALSSNFCFKNIPFHSTPTTALSGSDEDTTCTLGKEASPSIAAISDLEMRRSDSFGSITSSFSGTSEQNMLSTDPEHPSPSISHASTGTKVHDTSSQSTVHSLDAICSSESMYQSAESSSSMLSDDRNNSSLSKKKKDRAKSSHENSFLFGMSGEANTSQGSSKSDSQTNKSVRFSYENFTQLDHRIHLYLDMRVFQEGEKFESILQTNIQILGKGNEFSGLLILSNAHAYIYKIVGKEMTVPKKWMEKVEVFPLATLKSIRLHLGSQAFSLGFNASSSRIVCLFLLRDSYRCNNYFGYLTGCLKQRLKWTGESLEIVSLSQELMTPLQAVITNYMVNIDLSEQTYDVQVYLMGHHVNSAGHQQEPMSFVVASSYIFMVKENLQWIHSRNSLPNDSCANCFEIIQHENINDVVQLTIFSDATNEIKLKFLREDDDIELEWHIAMETEAAVSSLMHIIKDVWEKLFDINLPTVFQTLATN